MRRAKGREGQGIQESVVLRQVAYTNARKTKLAHTAPHLSFLFRVWGSKTPGCNYGDLHCGFGLFWFSDGVTSLT